MIDTSEKEEDAERGKQAYQKPAYRQIITQRLSKQQQNGEEADKPDSQPRYEKNAYLGTVTIADATRYTADGGVIQKRQSENIRPAQLRVHRVSLPDIS
ncbi:MAG: hypothetical protein IJE66_05420 [Akkermansia sp.]|nr:hypothetical protein [Akkermansia sp.]